MRGITAERVARATLRGYLKRKREVIVPWTMYVPQKIYQIFPAVVEWAMGRMAGVSELVTQDTGSQVLRITQLRQHGFHLALRVEVAGAAGGGNAVGEHGLWLRRFGRRAPGFGRP